jgi:hypothetical protein
MGSIYDYVSKPLQIIPSLLTGNVVVVLIICYLHPVADRNIFIPASCIRKYLFC